MKKAPFKLLVTSLMLFVSLLLANTVQSQDLVDTLLPETEEEITSSTLQSQEIIPEKTSTSTEELPEQDAAEEDEPGIQNRVLISYLDEIILDTEVFTTSTYFVDAQDTIYLSDTVTALGVLMNAAAQNNIAIDVLNFGWGYYVSQVNNITPEGFDGWIYNINMTDPGYAGINDYLIKDGDELELFYSVWPEKIVSDVSTTTVSSSVNFTSYHYSSSTWSIAPSTTISINSQLFTTDANGSFAYTPNATGTIEAYIYGTESWPQNSPKVSVEVLEIQTSEIEETEETANPGGNTSSGNSNTNYLVGSDTINNKIQQILNYLKTQQDETGKILDGATTDWLSMSFGARNMYGQDISKSNDTTSTAEYMKAYDLSAESELNICATYPRHYLALRATGIEDNSLIEKISQDCFIDGLYGQNGINDDVFALIALLAGQTDIKKQIIIDLVNNIAEAQNQQTGGFTMGWGDTPDATGVSINALKYAENKGLSIESEIFDNARKYLKNNQFEDGGWGYLDWQTNEPVTDILTTSWAMMGLNALGETQTNWTNIYNKNPWHVLTENLNDEGYYESPWAPESVDWFGIKHAVPALAGKSWPILLNTVGQTITPNPPSSSGSNNQTEPIVETPTTTLEIVTTTIKFVSSTPETTTEIGSGEKIVSEEIVEIQENTEIIEIAPTNTVVTQNTQTTPTRVSNTSEIRGEKIEDEITEIENEESSELISETENIEQLPDESNNFPYIPASAVALLVGGFGIWRLVKYVV